MGIIIRNPRKKYLHIHWFCVRHQKNTMSVQIMSNRIGDFETFRNSKLIGALLLTIALFPMNSECQHQQLKRESESRVARGVPHGSFIDSLGKRSATSFDPT